MNYSSISRAVQRLISGPGDNFFDRLRIVNEKHRLRQIPRYRSDITTLLKKPLEFIDGASLISAYDEIFENEIYRFESRNPDPYIIDGGANIGLSVIYFKMLYPSSSVLAFEPAPTAFKALERNIHLFELKDVTLCNKALWDSDAVLRFWDEGADGNRIESACNAENIVEVQSQRLSKFLDRAVDFLKIDIEGSEWPVLNECKDKLTKVANMFVEYHSFVDRPQELDLILATIRGAGLRYYIQSVGISSKRPFVRRDTSLSFDNQLNIFAYRD
jgi:FkbM family methyltransferase